MHKPILEVAKILGVLVLTTIVYVFMFGTSNFFVFDASNDMAGYDGAIAMIINAVEVPMAEYYETNTYQPNQWQMGNLENQVISKSLISGYSP